MKALLALFFFCSSTWAQEFMSSAGDPGKHKARLFFKTAFPVDTPENKSSTRLLDYSIYLPLYQNEDTTLAFSFKNNKIDFSDVSVNPTFKAVDSLSAIQYGFTYSMRDEVQSVWTVSAAYGSASDQPFKDNSVSAVDVTLSKKVDQPDGHSWIYFLNYSNNRPILNNIPLPGIAYTFMDQDKTSGGMIGIPFIMYWWRPTEKISTSVFTFMPSNLNLQLGYMWWGPLQTNLKFDWNQKVFIRQGRTENAERIYFDRKRWATSLKSYFGRSTFIEVEIARVFDQSLFDGESMFDKSSDIVPLDQEWQGTLVLQYEF